MCAHSSKHVCFHCPVFDVLFVKLFYLFRGKVDSDMTIQFSVIILNVLFFRQFFLLRWWVLWNWIKNQIVKIVISPWVPKYGRRCRRRRRKMTYTRLWELAGKNCRKEKWKSMGETFAKPCVMKLSFALMSSFGIPSD